MSTSVRRDEWHPVSCCAMTGAPLPAAGAAMPVSPHAPLILEGIEVSQAIQDMTHSVPLVADKGTVVRIYLGTNTATSISIRGEILVKHHGHPWIAVSSINSVQLIPSENGQLRLKRENIGKSLTFRLPDAVTKMGKCRVVLRRVDALAPHHCPLPLPHNAERTVDFMETPPLRVHIIGVRYQDSTQGATQTFEPRTKDFELIHSWLGRAYPVANVVWSQITVDGPNPWPFDAAMNNTFIRSVRAFDIAHGTDKRTHYFGLVDDAGMKNFMRGLASGVPTGAPDPSTVASGPTGTADWGWDFDGSYGDWYTGHELGHTFGRLHAEFCGASGGGPYPYPNGQISPNDGSFVGLDLGDSAHGLPMVALPGVTWHDLMSYCQFEWLSDFTYTRIRDRIIAEAALPASAVPTPVSSGGGNMPDPVSLHIVALGNLTKQVGSIQFVTPTPAASEGATAGSGGGNFTVELQNTSGKAFVEYPAPFYLDACVGPNADETGIVDVSVPWNSEVGSIQLLLNGKVVDRFEAGVRPMPAQNIQPLGPQAALGAAGASAPPNPVVTWDPGNVPAGAAAAPPGKSPTYIVQISRDNGKSWSTIGMGLKQPQVTIDRSLLSNTQSIELKVTSTNGVYSESSTKTISVNDL